ncbi:MAG: hypothetical protein IJ542_02940 [Clostridia bacterium]|nr:hypothetical protein [Clostridia bacterium]
MNYLKINLKNKNRKNGEKNIKNSVVRPVFSYKKLCITKIDKTIVKLSSKTPDIWPQYVIYNNKRLLIDLSKNITQKINSQIERYKSKNRAVLVEFYAKKCAEQVLKQEKVNVFEYLKSTYGAAILNKKEWKIFPYLFLDQLLKIVAKLNQYLIKISKDIRFGATTKEKLSYKFSNPVLYGAIKYNKNLVQIAAFSNINFQKCVFYFFVELSKIENKLSVIIRYIKVVAKMFSIKI